MRFLLVVSLWSGPKANRKVDDYAPCWPQKLRKMLSFLVVLCAESGASMDFRGGILWHPYGEMHVIRYSFLGLCIAILALVWTTFLVETEDVVQAAALLKRQAPQHVGIASAALAVIAFLIVMLPRLVSAKTPTATNTASAPPDEPAVVTPKRVANRRLQLRDQIFDDVGYVLSSGLEVRHLMTDQLLSVSPDTKLTEVRRVMEEEGIRHLAVSKAGEYGNIAGMISDRDIASRRGGYAMDIMTPAPMSICHGAKIQDAVDMMTDRGFSALLVTRGEITCGIITTTDLVIGLRATYDMLYTLVPDERLAEAAGLADASLQN